MRKIGQKPPALLRKRAGFNHMFFTITALLKDQECFYMPANENIPRKPFPSIIRIVYDIHIVILTQVI